MKTIAEINAIRDKMQAEIRMRKATNDIQIIVGMGDCGINNGAKEVFETLMEIANAKNLKNVKVSRAGCLGNCAEEPIVKVIKNGEEKVYSKVTKEKAQEIISVL